MNARKTTHYFSSTTDAYDACMTGVHPETTDPVRDGDILIIESERVIGLCDTWPVAVTAEHGALHALKSGYSPEDYFIERPGFPMQQVRHAKALAADRAV
jgi:hypothetical protein